MSEIRGTCQGCGKRFRVPRAGRTYTCKSCDGTVVVDEVPREAAPSGGRTCPVCGAISAATARFCEECGAALDSAPAPASGEDRRYANRQLVRAEQWIKLLRTLWTIQGVLLGVISALVVAVGAAFHEEAKSSLLYLVGLLGLLLAALFLVGAWQVRRHTLVWSLALATLTSVLFVLGIAGGSVPGIDDVFLLVSSWAGVGAALPLHRIQQEFPDLRLARKLRGELRGRRAPRHERGRSERMARRRDRGGWKRKLLIWGGVITAAVLLAVQVWRSTLPPSLTPSLRSFAEAWESGDAEGLAAFREPEDQPRFVRHFEMVVEELGWQEGTPPLGSLSVSGSDVRRRATWTVPGAERDLRTNWTLRDRRWVLTGVQYPR